MSNTPYNSYNMLAEKRHLTYNEWLRSSVVDTLPATAPGMRKMTHGEYIQSFYDRLTGIIRQNGMNIKNEKVFKKEIASFVYKASGEY